jgi:hypothetical protein
VIVGAALEAPAVVASLDDVAVVGIDRYDAVIPRCLQAMPGVEKQAHIRSCQGSREIT